MSPRPIAKPAIILIIASLVLPLRASTQSSCLPPSASVKLSLPAQGVHFYLAAAAHANRALILVDSANAKNVFFNLRTAVAELRCAATLVQVADRDSTTMIGQGLDLAESSFTLLALGFDETRKDVIRQADAGSVPETAAQADQRAATAQQAQEQWRNLSLVTLGLLTDLKGPEPDKRLGLVTAAERDALLAGIVLQFGKALTESDGRKSFPLLSAWTIQSFLKDPSWRYR